MSATTPDLPRSETPLSDEDRIKADIDRTRAELVDTVDALAARLDVKAQAKQRVHATAEKAAAGYEHAKTAAPGPVRTALGGVERVVAPVAARAGQDKKRTLLVVGGLLAGLLVLRRFRR